MRNSRALYERLANTVPTRPYAEVRRKLRAIAEELGFRFGPIPPGNVVYSTWDGSILRMRSDSSRQGIPETWAEGLAHEISHCIVAEKWRRSEPDWGLGPDPTLPNSRTDYEQEPCLSVGESTDEEGRVCLLQFCLLAEVGGLRGRELAQYLNTTDKLENNAHDLEWLHTKRLINTKGLLTSYAFGRGIR